VCTGFTGTVTEPTEMDTNPGRRKLLRGSLSAPMVLTVASPSALAATSFQACIARVEEVPQPSPTIAVISTRDSWLRELVQIYDGRLTGGGGTQQFYKAPDGFYYPLEGIANCLDPLASDDFVPMSLSLRSGDTRWALVYVDKTGAKVGYGLCPNNGYAVSASCWGSFIGTPPPA
jgi:hypothetical protein